MSEGLRRFIFDLGSAILLLAVALGGAFLPRYLALKGHSNGAERSLIFRLGNMLSAGVMLSACFCHLLASALKETEKTSRKFPLGPFLCAVGFLLTLAADQYAAYTSRNSSIQSIHSHKHNHLLDSNHVSSDAQEKPEESSSGPPLENRSSLQSEEQPGDIEDAADAAGKRRKVSFLTAVFLGLALSLHSVLEGLALGAQETINASRDVLVAIAAHKGLAAYALGASLVDSGASKSQFWRVAGGFSVASPIGILIGYALSEVCNGTVAASLSALASGTFLYVATMEIIPTELEDGENIVSKMLVMFFGFGAMSLLAVWA